MESTRLIQRTALATLLLAIVAATVEVPTAASATPAEKSYVALLKARYLPFRKAFVSATGPCLQRNLPRCRTTLAASDRGAAQLLTTLVRAPAPKSLRTPHRQLMRGVRELQAWIEKYVAAIDAGNDAALRTICACRAPTQNVTNAIGEISFVTGIDLPILA